VITSIVPTDKAADVGDLSVEKQADQMIVYNTGTYRGKFDISFYMKHSYQYTPNDEDLGFFNIVASNLDTVTFTWRQVDYKRSDGTLYLSTLLDNFDARGYYRRLTINWYNTGGTDIIDTKVYALDYDSNGLLYQRILLPS
jgi:hypothetical protein